MSAETPGKKRLATLLPAPQVPGSHKAIDGENHSPSHSRAAELPPKRQKRVETGRFACDACRSRKSAVRCISGISFSFLPCHLIGRSTPPSRSTRLWGLGRSGIKRSRRSRDAAAPRRHENGTTPYCLPLPRRHDEGKPSQRKPSHRAINNRPNASLNASRDEVASFNDGGREMCSQGGVDVVRAAMGEAEDIIPRFPSAP